MKRTIMKILEYILMAAAGIAAAACSADGPEVPGRDQITFSVAEKATRAGSQSSMSSTSTFGSYAWLVPESGPSDGMLYIPEEEISCKESVWKAWGTAGEPDHLYWWPSSGTLAFFGWAPYRLSSSPDGSAFSIGKDGFTLAGWNTLAAQDDILTASEVRDCGAGHGAVALTFSHALSALTFLLKVSNDPAETLTSCWLESPDRSFRTGGTLDCVDDGFRWSELAAAASDVQYYYDWECEGLSLGDSENGVRAYSDLSPAVQGKVFTSNSGDILVIPQKTSAGSLSFHFLVRDGSGNRIERSVSLPAEDYKAGKRYEYTITISPVLDVAVSIKDWNVRYASDDITF